MFRSRRFIWMLGVLIALPFGYLALLSMLASKPANLGVVNGRLADCPGTPNCVCTQASDPEHRMEPLQFQDAPATAMDRLKAILTAMPRCRIVTADERYLHAEVTTLLFRFVDDVEFLLDPATSTIQFRSASRSGHSDFGVNQQRMEDIRKQFKETTTR